MHTFHQSFSLHSETPIDLFHGLTEGKNRLLLESGEERHGVGEYSYIAWDPLAIFRSRGNQCQIEEQGKISKQKANPLELLEDFFTKFQGRQKWHFPFFCGGAIGFIGYEIHRFIEHLPKPKKDTELKDIEDVYFMVPRQILILDHRARELHLFFWDKSDNRTLFAETVTRIEALLSHQQKSQPGSVPVRVSAIRPFMKQKQFETMVRQAKEYIASGDIYQANLSQRFSFDYDGSPWELYKKLRKINPSPFSSFIDTGDLQVVSSSPERLISLKDSLCETRPIAGTRRRGRDFTEDGQLSEELLLNEKEKAEHLMLVDLERNDLGRVCDYKSVHVDEYMVLEKYSHVIHIVSNVQGRLKRGKNAFDLMKAMFPGGTITGCPKIRAMEIIHELEPVNRKIYTGSIGYFGFDGSMDLNIVIRTILCAKGKGFIQVGAGIVHDSVPTAEYEETLHKAQAMLEALGERQRTSYIAKKQYIEHST